MITLAHNVIKMSNGDEITVMFHVCNDADEWVRGMVSDRWPLAAAIYHAGSKKLGTVSIGKVEQNLYVANMIAKKGNKQGGNVPSFQYDAFCACLSTLAQWAANLKKDGTVVHCYGLLTPDVKAGGDKKSVERVIMEKLDEFKFTVLGTDE